jgi:SSS family solute:Na+ symporter
VPALVFAVGALGFFAVPYTIILYPLALLAAVRMWSVAHTHGFVTPADFVRGRHGSSTLALAVAITGIVATMPYIALQLVGIQAVLETIGISGHWPLILAFAVLACLHVLVGPARARADRVRQGLAHLPRRAGGDHRHPDPARRLRRDLRRGQGQVRRLDAPTDGVLLSNAATLGYSTLAFGSALALFLYPHSMTGILAARSRNTIKRNMVALPLYSLALGLLALMGYMAIAAGVKPINDNPNTIVPLLFDKQFGDVFAGVAMAAICIGALVPAAIMSIAAGEPLRAQHLPRVPQAGCDAAAGGDRLEGRVAGGQGRAP